jgi:hypothetical protein
LKVKPAWGKGLNYLRQFQNEALGRFGRLIMPPHHHRQWVSLGTYRFRGSNADYVSLADVTYEPRLSRLIAFDAVKWEPR